MKKLLPLIFSLYALAASAQDLVTHSYDAAGNRIQRAPQDYFAPVQVHHKDTSNNAKPLLLRSDAYNRDSIFSLSGDKALKTEQARQKAKQDSLSSATAVNREMDIRVYPNPVTDLLNLRLSDDYMARTGRQLLLYDSRGKLVKQYVIDNQSLAIDMSMYLPGCYLLKLTAQGFSSEYSVVKQ